MALILRLFGLVLIAAAGLTGTICATRFTVWQKVSPALADALFSELLSLFGFTLLLAMGGLLGIAVGGMVAEMERVARKLADPYDDHPKMAPGAYDNRKYLSEP
jgi:ABC-type anion transport system duplicated permease subunit